MRMAQYIGLTSSAKAYAEQEFLKIEDPEFSITLNRSIVVERKFWLDLAQNDHPLAVYKDPIKDIYYVEQIQVIAHSSGPMYFTVLAKYEHGQPVTYCNPWKRAKWDANLTEEFNLETGEIFICDAGVYGHELTFPASEDTLVYDQEKRHFIWKNSKDPVYFIESINGIIRADKLAVYAQQIGNAHYLVKVNAEHIVFSIQKLKNDYKPGDNASIVSRFKVPELTLDLASPVAKRYH